MSSEETKLGKNRNGANVTVTQYFYSEQYMLHYHI